MWWNVEPLASSVNRRRKDDKKRGKEVNVNFTETTTVVSHIQLFIPTFFTGRAFKLLPMADPATFIATWFTPSSLFIFVNLVIGTIAITSRLATTPQNHPQLRRSPSLLDRLRSFNLTHYNDHHESSFVAQTERTQPQLVRSPSLLERISSFNLALHKHQPTHAETQSEPENAKLVRTPSFLQRLQSVSWSTLYRSEEKPSGDDSGNLEKSKAEMRKSASEKGGSMKSEWEEQEETVERRRPATMRSETASSSSWKGDEEVDAKADDFINRFKKQLRLQRMESIIRYRAMMSGSN
ncbi:hypothetical protein VNO77_23864 [Canavalia gladiata]|uniref:DUF4408 domain-containing protein n=1 Tax=Canavalia gladiata TaxID=3824 RepID=A0AAN9QC75_CANGL